MARPKSSKTVKKRPYHRGNLRELLIETGVRLIQEKGVRALTLREIGSRLGVSRMAAYRHFSDKADLLIAIRNAGFIEFAGALEKARLQAPDGFASRFAAMAVAYVKFAAEHPAHFEVMFGSNANRAQPLPHTDPGARAFGILEQTIREAQHAGEVRLGDSVQLARVAWALVHGISLLHLDNDLTQENSGTSFTWFSSEMLRTGLAPGRAVENNR